MTFLFLACDCGASARRPWFWPILKYYFNMHCNINEAIILMCSNGLFFAVQVAVHALTFATKAEKPEPHPSDDEPKRSPSSMAHVHRCFFDLRKRFDCLSSIMEFLPNKHKEKTLEELKGESKSSVLEGRSRMVSVVPDIAL